MTNRGVALPGRWRTARIAVFLRFAAFVPIVLGCIYLLVYLPAAPAVAVISATIQSVTFEVSVPEMAQIRLTGFALSYEATAAGANLGFQNKTLASPTSRKPLCLTGVLIPEPGTRMTYRRFGTNPVSIIFERSDGKPAASFDLANGAAPPEARQASWIRLDAHGDGDDDKSSKQKGCEGESTTLLPIYGAADLGTEMRPIGRGEESSSGLLIEGTLNIFGKTIEPSAYSEGATRIYPASTTSITLPPGSRIIEYVKDGTSRQAWAGFAQADADTALDVKVSTPATRLAIIRPGLGLKPEVLSIGLFTQLGNDPILLSAQLIVATLFAVLQALSAAFSLFSSRQRANTRNDEGNTSDNEGW